MVKSPNQNNSIDTDVLTVQEAAEYLKVSKFTIKRWLREGKLKGSKLAGNRWKVYKTGCDLLLHKGDNLDG